MLPKPRGVIDRPILGLLTLGEKRLGALKTIFFRIIRVWGGLYCLKLTGEKAGIGLRRENFEIPESKILEPLFS